MIRSIKTGPKPPKEDSAAARILGHMQPDRFYLAKEISHDLCLPPQTVINRLGDLERQGHVQRLPEKRGACVIWALAS